MKVNVYHKDKTETPINVRYTDEVAEELGLSDTQFDAMNAELQKTGRYWVGDYYLTRFAK